MHSPGPLDKEQLFGKKEIKMVSVPGCFADVR